MRPQARLPTLHAGQRTEIIYTLRIDFRRAINNTLGIMNDKHVLRSYREQRQLSRQQLADKLKCSFSLVQLIEDGHRQITPQKAVEWEPILGIPREKLCPQIFAKARAA